VHEFQYWLKIANFSQPLSFSALDRGGPFRIYGRALLILKLGVFQAADGEDLVILACTVFDLSTRVTDGRTELRWLRRAKAVQLLSRVKIGRSCGCGFASVRLQTLQQFRLMFSIYKTAIQFSRNNRTVCLHTCS